MFIYQIIKTGDLVAIEEDSGEILKMKLVGVLKRDEYEKVEKMKKMIKKEKNKTKKKQKTKKWSRNYDKCLSCGGVDSTHRSNGLCYKCYTPKKVKELGLMEFPKSSCLNRYFCQKCKIEFDSVLSKLDVICPDCGSIKIEKI